MQQTSGQQRAAPLRPACATSYEMLSPDVVLFLTGLLQRHLGRRKNEIDNLILCVRFRVWMANTRLVTSRPWLFISQWQISWRYGHAIYLVYSYYEYHEKTTDPGNGLILTERTVMAKIAPERREPNEKEWALGLFKCCKDGKSFVCPIYCPVLCCRFGKVQKLISSCF